jgi:UDP-glucose 4-epimerase
VSAAHILVTGGAGFIGSHTVVELLDAGYDVTIVDDLSNSKPEAVERVATICGRGAELIVADVTDEQALDGVFARRPVDSVIHFAGLKAVGESVERPLDYYRVNVAGSVALCRVMDRHGVRRLVFSSSATVYGDPEQVPIPESAPAARATNPYGHSKVMIEQILADLAAADDRWHIALLRYFNPVGAHRSGMIGEDPQGIPNNLMPYLAQVAVRRLPYVRVYGDDYPTPDGTGIRDYIHVVDLAAGHLSALQHLDSVDGAEPFNLGTGHGTSVMEMIRAFEAASGREIPYEVTGRRPGDVAVTYADPSKVHRLWGWRAERDIDEMCADTWRWQSTNPDGY